MTRDEWKYGTQPLNWEGRILFGWYKLWFKWYVQALAILAVAVMFMYACSKEEWVWAGVQFFGLMTSVYLLLEVNFPDKDYRETENKRKIRLMMHETYRSFKKLSFGYHSVVLSAIDATIAIIKLKQAIDEQPK